MKKLCFVSSYACLGGAEKSLQSLILGFDKKGYKILVVLGETGPLSEWLEKKNINYKVIPQPSLKKGISKILFPVYLIRFIFKFLFLIKQNKIDVIHTNTFRSRLYCSLIKPLYSCKLIAHVRDIEASRFDPYLLKKYDTTIVISEAVKKAVLAYVKPDNKIQSKIHTVYNGVEATTNDHCLAHRRDDFIKIAMFARFDEWKCQHIFVKAAIEVNKRHSNILFYLFGDALRESEVTYKKSIEHLIDEEKAHGFIKVQGFVSDPLLEMEKMDLVVCPSDNEPFGRVIIEAMASGVVVIGSSNGGITEILNSELKELTFEPRNELALAAKINEYIENKEAWDEKYKKLLRIRFEERFSIQQLISNIENIYIN